MRQEYTAWKYRSNQCSFKTTIAHMLQEFATQKSELASLKNTAVIIVSKQACGNANKNHRRKKSFFSSFVRQKNSAKSVWPYLVKDVLDLEYTLCFRCGRNFRANWKNPQTKPSSRAECCAKTVEGARAKLGHIILLFGHHDLFSVRDCTDTSKILSHKSQIPAFWNFTKVISLGQG